MYKGSYTPMSKIWILKMPVQLLIKIILKLVGTADFLLKAWQVLEFAPCQFWGCLSLGNAAQCSFFCFFAESIKTRPLCSPKESH